MSPSPDTLIYAGSLFLMLSRDARVVPAISTSCVQLHRYSYQILHTEDNSFSESYIIPVISYAINVPEPCVLQLKYIDPI